MCGIVAYTGPSPATPILIRGLSRLEYRGYDSAGIAVQDGGGIVIIKAVGKVSQLAARAQPHPAGTTGIAHTRWATHGAPNEANAHPHTDTSGRIAVVHNGIVENYRALRTRLEAEGVVFRSQTDTEVIAHLVAKHYKGSLIDAVTAVMPLLHGTAGLAITCADEPGLIVAARRGSPIVIGVGDEESIIASDATAIIAHTRRVIYLEENDIAAVTATGVEIRNADDFGVQRSIHQVEMDSGAIEKNGFAHFMLKEIHDQPEAVFNAIRGRLNVENGTAVLAGMQASARELAEIRRILLIGCGTSLHAGLVGEYAFEDLAGIPAKVYQSAEFRYRNPIVERSDLAIAISQSGETADTLAAVREATQKGAAVMSLCNVVGSTIARETGRGVYLHAGPEISVASTKAFTCQVAVLLLIALRLARSRRMSLDDGRAVAEAIAKLPDLIRTTLRQADAVKRAAEQLAGAEHAYFIGRGPMHPVALEGALKLKEISYIHAEGYHAAELKHGPIALLRKGTPVIALACRTTGADKIHSNIEECQARGAAVIAVITEGDPAPAGAVATLAIPPCHPLVAVIPATILLQLLAYHTALLRGCEIDQPRNLAKSVTVE